MTSLGNRIWLASAFAVFFCSVSATARCAEDEAEGHPVTLDRDLMLELVLTAPKIVNPIGIAVDGRGRVAVIESHTHFRPADYTGPKTDRVLLFEDKDLDGTLETRTVFAEGLTYAMNISFTSDGAAVVVQRDQITSYRDTDDDGISDEKSVLVRLETTSSYPHNGLGGLAHDAEGWIYFGLGENDGASFTLFGSDGAVARSDEAGKIFRCDTKGGRLELYAKGFWNPFALALWAPGSLLAADNDPETRPPNRLLDVIAGGDFGFRGRYGKEAEHPFVAWNGELPGTLPMMGMVGEAAAGLLPTAGLRWPKSYRDSVLVSSWSDRRIEAHQLIADGSTFKSSMRVLVQGGPSFHPVALARSPNGDVFLTDWAKRDYAVHTGGRVWRLRPAKSHGKLLPSGTTTARQLMLGLGKPNAPLTNTMQTIQEPRGDDFLRSSFATALAREPGLVTAKHLMGSRNGNLRLASLLAFKHASVFMDFTPPEALQALRGALADASLDLRMAALIWGAEGRLLSKGDLVLLQSACALQPSSPALRAVCVAAFRLLGMPLPPSLRPPTEDSWLARLLLPTHEVRLVRAQQEAIWHLADSLSDRVWKRLAQLPFEKGFAGVVRADAVGALAMQGRAQGLTPLVDDASPEVRVETVRALRTRLHDPETATALRRKLSRIEADHVLASEIKFALQIEDAEPRRPATPNEWAQALAEGLANADAGRRVFVHPAVGCVKCHRAGFLGQNVGPPLTFIGGERPQRLLESLLSPSLDIVWSARQFDMRDGSSVMGMVKARAKSGDVSLVNAGGQILQLAHIDILSETKADASLMPDGLLDGLSVQAVRDLFAFLRQSVTALPFASDPVANRLRGRAVTD